MQYKFTTHPVGDYKMVHFRGKANHQIMVSLATSPKKFLGYLEELKKTGYILDPDENLEFIHRIFETTLLSRILNSPPSYPDAIMNLKINEYCLAYDSHDLYKVTRISRHLCHCECLPYAW